MAGKKRPDTEEDLEYRQEVEKLNAELGRFGITAWDLAVKRPRRWQHRELAKKAALHLARDSRLWGLLQEQGRLPVQELEAVSGAGTAFVEANSAYITALALLMKGEYRYLSAYVRPEAEGGFRNG